MSNQTNTSTTIVHIQYDGTIKLIPNEMGLVGYINSQANFDVHQYRYEHRNSTKPKSELKAFDWNGVTWVRMKNGLEGFELLHSGKSIQDDIDCQLIK